MIGEHIHPILHIEIEGVAITIPGNIGLTDTRHFNPHTHDDDEPGTLHIGETPEAGIDPLGSPPRLVILKDFFDVWRTTNPGTPLNNPNAFFSSTQLLDRLADATHAVFMTVNGQPNTEFENYSPHDLDQVLLSYQTVVNLAPVANPQTVDTIQNLSTPITLTGDDGNPEGVIQTLRFRINALPANGTLNDSNGNPVVVGADLPTPNVTYLSSATFSGTDSFRFLVVDNGGTANGGQDTSAPADVTINVAAAQANQPPTANPLTVRVTPNTPTPVRLSGDDGDPQVTQALSFRVQTVPANGTLRDSGGNLVTAGTTLPSPNLTFTPNTGFTGTDGFTFNVTDDGAGTTGGPLTSQAASVVLNVTPPADPAGFVYVDANANGVMDQGEPGIPGVLMKLCGVEDDGNVVQLSQLTASDGSYRFDQLWPGVYEVIEVQPEGYLDGQETLGTMGGLVSNDRFYSIVLGPGDVGEGYNFGELPICPPAEGVAMDETL
jgi:hypothetical protein